jgi:CheY-specific phosphatase CheX
VKNVLILSDNKLFKKDLTAYLVLEERKNKINYLTVSTRANAIAELSQKEYDSIVIDCTLVQNDLQLILKYLSTNEYYFCHIFFLSENFVVFQEILSSLNFPHINLISLPISIDELGNKITNCLFPKDTSKIDQSVKINLDFLKVFIDSTKRVLREFCSLEKLEHKKPFLKTVEKAYPYAVIGTIALKSEIFEGVFSIGFTADIYLALVNKVLLLEIEEMSEEIMDFAAELVNMIYGQAKFILNDAGYNFLKVIPTFEMNPIYTPSKHHIVIVPIETDFGIIYIEVLVIKIKGMNF